MKKTISLFLILIMVISLAACASPQSETPVEPDPPVVDKPIEKPAEDPIKEDEKKEAEVNIYFTNEEYVINGDESLEKIKPERRTVDYTSITLEEAVVREVFTDAKEEGLINSIPPSVKLNEVTIKDDTIYVDFAEEGLSGSSMQESLTINQILQSLFDLEGKDKVQFLVDGQEAESLMGHISINEAFENLAQ